jgi:hypothetical protein
VIVPRRSNNTRFSEAEAAQELKLSVEEFRRLILEYVVETEGDIQHSPTAVFHSSDLLVLRLLSGRATVPTTPG